MRNIKVYTEILTFGKTDIENDKFYRHKSPIFLEDVNIKKVLVSNKIYFGEKNYKHLISYLYNDFQHIMLPKASAYVKSYDGQ